MIGLFHGAGIALAGFQPQQTFATGASPLSVAIADLNGDGRPDLAITNLGSDTVSVLLGNGNGTFQPQQTFATGGAPTGVAIADLNGDGRPDLAIANSASDTVSVLLGNGDGAFQAHQTFATGAGPASVAIADLNGDGPLDLAVANLLSNTVSALLGNGNGTFQPQQTYATGTAPRSVAIADLSGDGTLDFATANSSSGAVSVLLGNGDGTFQAQQTYATGAGPVAVAITDLNGDGPLDLAVANNSGTVSVLLGNGNGTFQGQQGFPAGSNPFSVAIADLNGDGWFDLAITNLSASTVSVLAGTGNGTYQPQQSFATGTDPRTVAIADLNSDGRPDLAIVNGSSNTVSVLVGNPSGALQFSSADVTVAESGGAVTFTLTRSGSTDGQVSALISLTGGTATAGQDVTFSSPQTVTWTDGDGASKSISIPIIQDQLDEGEEIAQFTVSLPSNPFGATLGPQTGRTVTITDDDPLALSIAGSIQAEGNNGGTTANFTVTRIGATVRPVMVQYTTADGSARAGADYVATSGVLTFAPNEPSKTISVPIIADTLAEPDETFTLTLSNPTNATLSVTQAIGVIENDDLVSACGPRPRVTQTLTAGGGALAVQIQSSPLNTPANNPLQSIRFGTFQNATVTLNGQPVTSGQTVTLPANTVGAALTVRRVTAGQATMVPFTVVDACGTWETFVGGGANAGF